MYTFNINNNNKLINLLGQLEKSLDSIKENGKYKNGTAERKLSEEINEFYKSNSFSFDLDHTNGIMLAIDRCVKKIYVNNEKLAKKVNNVSKSGLRAAFGLAVSKEEEKILSAQIENLARSLNVINQVKTLLNNTEKKRNAFLEKEILLSGSHEIKLNESNEIYESNNIININNENNSNYSEIEKIKEDIKEIDRFLEQKVSRFGIRSKFGLALSPEDAKVLRKEKKRLMNELNQSSDVEVDFSDDDDYILKFERTE